MKAGDIVLYSIAGNTHKAIVLHAHSGQPQLLGKNGEPLLHLAFIAPERESAVQRAKFSYIPQVFTEFDVAHCSQEFSEEYRRANGLNSPALLAQARGQGEWSELPAAEPDEVALAEQKVSLLLDENARLSALLNEAVNAIPPQPPLPAKKTDTTLLGFPVFLDASIPDDATPP